MRDPWVRRQLTPTEPPQPGNVAYSDSFHRTLGRVELLFWPIAGAVPDGLRTADGIEHHVDAVVLL